MTAEIAIMNKSAVALAADSAISYTINNRSKIYNTANKLFTLSKHSPQGIMFYGTAEFLGVPWETVIKLYRKEIGRKVFPRLSDQADNFREFLLKNKKLFNDYSRKQTVLVFAQIIINALPSFMSVPVEKASPEQVEAAIDQVMENIQKLEKLEIQEVTKEYKERFLKNEDIENIIKNTIPRLAVNPSSMRIRDLVFELVSRRSSSFLHSGIVISGFGEEEIFPSLVHFIVDGIVGDNVRIESKDSVQVSPESPVGIFPFAQRHTIEAFASGIDPDLSKAMMGYLGESTSQLLEKIAGFIKEKSNPSDNSKNPDFGAFSKEAIKEFEQKMADYQQLNFIGPLHAATATLPKEELAAMAESLVNLASFKQRITLDTETVGGPIDVAVISKGDGFIWIKRKHYFKPELNIGFVENYFPTASSKTTKRKK